MSECAFCPSTAKLSGEHVFSQWMGRLFPHEKEFTVTDRFGNQRTWVDEGLDITVKVVCEPCNTGWMSDMEAAHAEPTMTPMMMGNVDAPFAKSEAKSLALFAFKSAVILDSSQRYRAPFFSKRIRYDFKESLFIPRNVGMWMGIYLPDEGRKRRFDYHVMLNKGELTRGYDLHLFVVTFGIGALAFQVVTHKQIYWRNFAPLPGFENVCEPFWPVLRSDYVWPEIDYIRSREHLIEFHQRWAAIAPV